MANWCSTKFVFYSNKDEILELHNRLNRILGGKSRILNDFGKAWLGNILIDYGFDWEDAPCRGNAEDLAGDIIIREEEAYFDLDVTSAWSPLTEMWDLILKKEYPSIKYVYLAIEPGAGIFINTDTSGKYLPEKYLLDLILPNDEDGEDIDVYEFYDSPEELLEDLEKYTGKKFKDIDKARRFFEEKLDEIEDVYGEYHAIIAEFKTDETNKEEAYEAVNAYQNI